MKRSDHTSRKEGVKGGGGVGKVCRTQRLNAGYGTG